MTQKCIYSILVLLMQCTLWVNAQEQNTAPAGEAYETEIAGPDEKLIKEMETKMQDYISEMNDLVIAISVYPPDSLQELQRDYKILDTKWNTYYQAQQMDIATSDELLDLVAQYQLLSQSASESLSKVNTTVDAQNTFQQALDFITSQHPVYDKMYKEAMTLQMVAKLGPKLEKLKTQEQVMFSDIEANYQKARQAASIDPSLEKDMKDLDECYYDLKNVSMAIQAAVYKPFIQRIKDKLLIAAAMAILLMFLTMVTSKIQALKKARDMAKKFKSQFQNDQQYPTI